jgi:hypothetical protein
MSRVFFNDFFGSRYKLINTYNQVYRHHKEAFFLIIPDIFYLELVIISLNQDNELIS